MLWDVRFVPKATRRCVGAAVQDSEPRPEAFLALYVLHEVRNVAEERTEDEEN